MNPFTTSRTVALLTGLVFGPAAAVGTAWLQKHFPGIPAIPKDQIVAVEISAYAGVVALGLKWLHGRAQHESAQAKLETDTAASADSLKPGDGPAPLNAKPDTPPGEPTPAEAALPAAAPPASAPAAPPVTPAAPPAS